MASILSMMSSYSGFEYRLVACLYGCGSPSGRDHFEWKSFRVSNGSVRLPQWTSL